MKAGGRRTYLCFDDGRRGELGRYGHEIDADRAAGIAVAEYTTGHLVTALVIDGVRWEVHDYDPGDDFYLLHRVAS